MKKTTQEQEDKKLTWTVRVFDTFSRDDYEKNFKDENTARTYARQHSGTMLQAVVYADGNMIARYGTY